MKTINLDGWTLMSERQVSKNFISPDRKEFVKYYKAMDEATVKEVEEEHDISEKVRAMGIPTPEALGLVEIEGGGVGALYENIDEKKSISRAISQDRSRLEECVDKFVALGKKIHSTPCDTSKFESIEDRLLRNLDLVSVFTPEQDKKIRDFIAAVPKAETCLHGDFHPGNFITSPSGDYAIDLGHFGYGNPKYDWAQWFFLSHIVPEEDRQQIFHMTIPEIIEMWRLSVKKYFGYETEEEVDAFEREMMDYQAFICVAFYGIFDKVEFILQMMIEHNPFFR